LRGAWTFASERGAFPAGLAPRIAAGDRVRGAYGDDEYSCLVALKDTYDPTNLFRLNQNISPSRATATPALA
jgi:Berberine and berberine like